MSARQIVFLASQVNKIIQKKPRNIGHIEQFCTILSNIFKQVVGCKTQLCMHSSVQFFASVCSKYLMEMNIIFKSHIILTFIALVTSKISVLLEKCATEQDKSGKSPSQPVLTSLEG